MRRREFLGALATAATWPLVAQAQRLGIPVIGFLGSASPETTALELKGFREGLSAAGYVEGSNLTVEYCWAEGEHGRLRALADNLVHQNVAAIVVAGNAAALAVKAATSTIPIIGQVGSDPVAEGLVASLARPGGNLTGVTTLSAEIVGKRLELLHQLCPTVSRFALLVNPTNRDSNNSSRVAELAAGSLSVQLSVVTASTAGEIDEAFASFEQLRVGALEVAPDAFFNSRSKQLAALTLRHAVPAIYQYREFTASGGLISYGANITESYRLVAAYTARILRGETAADLPMQQATKVELFINLKAAKALGLTVPEALLASADEVIE
jgi:putative ABC transport system substrate-binding protein